jgi:hypothetical protein
MAKFLITTSTFPKKAGGRCLLQRKLGLHESVETGGRHLVRYNHGKGSGWNRPNWTSINICKKGAIGLINPIREMC